MALTQQEEPNRPPSAAPLPDQDAGAELPGHELPHKGIGSEAAYDLISSELLLDGHSRLNLATFVTTWMPKTAALLMAETADKNMIDKDEYPQTAEIESRCVNMLARLWNSPGADNATGCSTTGSSEACMLGGLALKWRWRERMRAAGKPTDRPNLVMGINVQVCWEKFCRYWDVEPRQVPMEGERYRLSPEDAVALCDENTIGVVGILGSTFDGSYEPIKDIADALDRLEADKGIDVPHARRRGLGRVRRPVHPAGDRVGFPDPPGPIDQRLRPQVRARLPRRRLGRVARSRGVAAGPRVRRQLPRRQHAHVRAELLPAGERGDRAVLHVLEPRPRGATGAIMQGAQDVARYISGEIASMGPYRLLTDGSDLPVFAFALDPSVTNYTVFEVSDRLRQAGWLVPAYTFPKNREDLSVLRIVVRAGMTREMAEVLVDHLRAQTEFLEALDGPLPGEKRAAFAHN